MSTWRCEVGKKAAEAVDSDIAAYLSIMQAHADACFRNGTISRRIQVGKKETKAYVMSKLSEPERPFLWLTNEETEVTDSKEPGGYAVVR